MVRKAEPRRVIANPANLTNQREALGVRDGGVAHIRRIFSLCFSARNARCVTDDPHRGQLTKVFDESAMPILEYFRTHSPDRYCRVNGEQPLDAVYEDTRRVLNLPESKG